MSYSKSSKRERGTESVHSLFAESESFVLLSFYVQKTTGAAVHGATGGAMGRGTGRGMKTARERVERKPRVRRAIMRIGSWRELVCLY